MCSQLIKSVQHSLWYSNIIFISAFSLKVKYGDYFYYRFLNLMLKLDDQKRKNTRIYFPLALRMSFKHDADNSFWKSSIAYLPWIQRTRDVISDNPVYVNSHPLQRACFICLDLESTLIFHNHKVSAQRVYQQFFNI